MYNTEVTQTSKKAPVQNAGNDEVLKTPREMALGLGAVYRMLSSMRNEK